MKGPNNNDEGKEKNPIMFPMLHIKDATKKGGPKAPPRNKVALYENLITPSQSTLHSASRSPSFLPLPLLRNHASTPSSRHVSSSHCTEFGTSDAPTFLTEKLHVYHSRVVNLNEMTCLFQLDDFLHCENSLKKVDGEDALEYPDSSHGRNSFYSISQNTKDEDKLRSQNSLRKKVNINDSIELKSDQEEHKEDSQICQNPMEFIKLETIEIGPAVFKEEIKNMSGSSLKLFHGKDCEAHEEQATIGDKTKHKDGFSRTLFWSDRDRHEGIDIYRNYDASNKPVLDSRFSMDIVPNDVLPVIGGKRFWKARSTIINQQRVFHEQVFELHRLIQVQRIIARSHHLLLEDKFILTKPSQELTKSQPQSSMAEQPSSIAKLSNNKLMMKPPNEDGEKNNVVGNIPLLPPIPHYSHHSGNQWLVPLMSPSEGLIYKPFVGPCPPSSGLMAPPPLPISLNLGDNSNNNASDSGYTIPYSHQMNIPFANMQKSKGPENHKSSSAGHNNTILMSQNNYYSSLDFSQIQSNKNCDPYKRMMMMNEDVCSLIPVASSSANQNSQVVVTRPQVIKAKPHNPKTASESAARIFRSIQEERRRL